VEAPASVQGRFWRSGKLQHDFRFDKISDYLAEPDTLVWADVCDPDHEALSELADELGLNRWAVEDSVSAAERVKATNYSTHMFLTVYGIPAPEPEPGDPSQPALSMRRVSAFVLAQALITVRLSPAFDIDKVTQRWDDIGGQEYGVGALVHGLLDVVVDSHFEAVEALDDRLERIIDNELFNEKASTGALQRQTFQMRRDLTRVRRVAIPMREVVNSMLHHRLDAATPRALDAAYLDLSDHVARVSEWTESLRDLVTSVFETSLSLQDARLNNIMKKLSAWAAIIAVPTAITGYFGQNVPYPGYAQWSGFVGSTICIVVIVIALYLNFRGRDWL
jgi:magnesium transporter